MRLADMDRHTWEDPNVRIGAHTTSRPLYWSRVDTVVVHYTADGQVGRDTAAYLRAIQSSYVRSRGYSIGYSYAIDQSGICWELRGEAFMPAATANHNSHTVAVLMLVDAAHPANDDMVVRMRRLVEQFESRTNRALGIVGHRDLGATACPGEGLYSQVRTGTFNPIPTAPSQTGQVGRVSLSNSKEGDMHIIQPIRVYDSRSGQIVGANSSRVIQSGMAGKKAVFANITVTGPQAGGYLTAWDGAGPLPNVSNLNFDAGQTIANGTYIPLNHDGSFAIYTSANTHFIVDVQGVV